MRDWFVISKHDYPYRGSGYSLLLWTWVSWLLTAKCLLYTKRSPRAAHGAVYSLSWGSVAARLGVRIHFFVACYGFFRTLVEWSELLCVVWDVMHLRTSYEGSIFSPSRSLVCLWWRRVVEWLRSGGIWCSDVAFTTLVLYHPVWWSIYFLSLCFFSVYLICRSSGSRRIGGNWFLLCFCWAVVLIGASSEIVISDICLFPTIESINIQNLFFVCGVLRLL